LWDKENQISNRNELKNSGMDSVGVGDDLDKKNFENEINNAEVEVYNAEEIAVLEEKGFNLFEQRQLEYFVGKRVEKDIILDNSDILRVGERITSENASHITTGSTLLEVTSHLQKN